MAPNKASVHISVALLWNISICLGVDYGVNSVGLSAFV
ncbi:MAG: hypothetical protein ACJAWS_003018 [Oleiphilaceae bacterium]|jgi:hypothetical protein